MTKKAEGALMGQVKDTISFKSWLLLNQVGKTKFVKYIYFFFIMRNETRKFHWLLRVCVPLSHEQTHDWECWEWKE